MILISFMIIYLNLLAQKVLKNMIYLHNFSHFQYKFITKINQKYIFNWESNFARFRPIFDFELKWKKSPAMAQASSARTHHYHISKCVQKFGNLSVGLVFSKLHFFVTDKLPFTLRGFLD